jgi:hypothetical protein
MKALHNSNHNQQHLLFGRNILPISRITSYPSFKARFYKINNNKCANVTVKVARITLQ